MPFPTKESIHTHVYFILLAALIVAIPTSNFVMSAAQILLVANWLIEWNMKAKFAIAKKRPVLLAFLTLFTIHILWIFLSTNWEYAIEDVCKKLPLLVIPLVICTSNSLSSKKIHILLLLYCISVFGVSIYSWINHFLHPEIPYRNLFPYISHIRLALNTCFVIFIILRYMVAAKSSNTWRFTNSYVIVFVISSFAIIWFLSYLLLLQSYTGFIILLASGYIICFCVIHRIHNKILKRSITFSILITSCLIMGMLGYYIYGYYHVKPLSKKPYAHTTQQGNIYQHAKDGFIENGNYINDYICTIELETEWAKKSSKSMHSITPNGYPIFPTLVRYINSLGFPKDSSGISQLTKADVESIENGVATPFETQKLGIRKMVYRLLFGYENYRIYGKVKDFSVLQRLELWDNSWSIFLQHPIFGVGTGDVADVIRDNLVQRHSELQNSNMRTHNQFLTFMLTFGSVGFILIVSIFTYAIRKEKLFQSLLFVAFFCIFILSFLSEDTLETEAGCVFTTFFFTVLAQNIYIGQKTNHNKHTCSKS